VAASYFLASAHRDPFGFAYIPFLLLALPWSALATELMRGLAPNSHLTVAFAIIALLGSGVNAVLLYWGVFGLAGYFGLVGNGN